MTHTPRRRSRARSAPRGRPWGTLSTPISRTTRSGIRSVSTARGRTAHLAAFFGRAARAAGFTTHQIRQYQLARRAAGAATGTINRETSALHRMGTLAVHWGWLDTVPGFPARLRENPPRQGFFEHPEYLAVRAHLPAPWQDILDLAYYSGWRKQEILGLTWEEIDTSGTGKTHLALALGLAACQKGYRVRFTTAAALVNELLEARDDKRLLRVQKQLAKQDLVDRRRARLRARCRRPAPSCCSRSSPSATSKRRRW